MRNELRIGNFIKDDLGRIARVSLISEQGIEARPLGLNQWSKVINPEPVPIIELLFKFGFEKCFPSPNQYANESLRIFFPPQFTEIPYPYCMLNKIAVNVSYFHTLQNLHFILTGKELELITSPSESV